VTLGLILLIAACVSLLLTDVVVRYAARGQLVDAPNGRSAHTVPTPRGGGMAISGTFLLAVGLFAWSGHVGTRVAAALAGGGAVAAIVGFIDDHRHVPAGWRLATHCVAGAWVLVWLGGMPPLQVAGFAIHLGWGAPVVGVLYLAWLLNIYNFMDGIDGIAGVEAVTICLGAAGMSWLYSGPGGEWMLAAILAMACVGFLVRNWPPASIFMGDSGSGFLGLTIGALSIRSAWVSPPLLWGWVILLGVFIVDTTVTMLRRLGRGERLYEAHSMHAYQHAARRVGAHRPVTLAVAAINVLWLVPIALVVGAGRVPGWEALVVAYAPLVWLALHLKAGTPAALATSPPERQPGP
jgi:Fuc2NAc and GlcNAc transferase